MFCVLVQFELVFVEVGDGGFYYSSCVLENEIVVVYLLIDVFEGMMELVRVVGDSVCREVE